MNNINNEIKIARYLGISRLKDMNVDTYLYLCPNCDHIFNALASLNGKEILCISCKNKIKLEKQNGN